MIILDTRVVSEALKPRPNAAVLRWLNGQNEDDLHLAAISLSELLSGVEIMPPGKRRDYLRLRMRAFFHNLFGGRILAFGVEAAERHAQIMGKSQAIGLMPSTFDRQIAAIAAVHGLAVATRDVAPFRAAGLAAINPWTDE
jgi:predicted nucleic acid-binding protein